MKSANFCHLVNYFVLFTQFSLFQIYAKPRVSFLPNKSQVKEIVLENDVYSYKIAIDNAVKLVHVIDKTSDYDYMKDSGSLIFTSSPDPGSSAIFQERHSL